MVSRDRMSSTIDGSFCGTQLPDDQDGKNLVVAGPDVFICRDCVGLCLAIFAEKDAAWRDAAIRQLEKVKPIR